MSLVFGSVCSGIGAPEAAWLPLGWRCAFMSEIEKFPRAVLAHHYPNTPLHGDFTTIEADDYEPIDLLVGGTPCQDFSIAGLRAGMAGDRGNLTLQFLALARRLRSQWVVWENVPGVLSSNGGRDFGAFLGGLGELGYGWAYRTLDAQFFGVAQRRRRVFVVGYLGDWRRPAAVLFERQSLCGDSAPRRATRQGTAYSPGCSPGYNRSDAGRASIGWAKAFGGGAECNPTDVATAVSTQPRYDYEVETFLVAPPITFYPYGDHESRESQLVAGTLQCGRKSAGSATSQDASSGLLVAHSLSGEGFDASEDGTGRGTPLVPVAFRTTGNDGVYETGDQVGALTTSSDPNAQIIAFSSKDHGADAEIDLAPTLRAGGHDGSHANAGVPPAIAFALRGRKGGAMPEAHDQVSALRSASGGSTRDFIAFDTTQITSKANRSSPKAGDPSHPLAAGAHAPAIAFNVTPSNSNKDYNAREASYAQAVTQSGGRPSARGGDMIAVPLLEIGKGTSSRGEGPNGSGLGVDGDPMFTLQAGAQHGVGMTSAVRRLTPRECERLQGFADDFTLIPWRGGMAPDGPRYKALGNSMAQPVVAWIGRRIELVCALTKRAAA